MSERAEQACVAYDHWAREVARLTEAIGLVQCPNAPDGEYSEGDDGATFVHRVSCFERERHRMIVAYDGEPIRRVWLAEVADAVRDCPGCSRLCALIAERKEARKKWGVAKRAIRRAALAALNAPEALP